MAILYIGPHRNPDFQSDYQLSPILAPERLLARFPPLLMSCGEKDPFVDDTIIFAGRVREAKRARRAELTRILAAGAGGGGSRAPSEESMRALHRERARLASETEEDWVQTHIFSEWSHGYLQMPSLMREARAVIDDLADWIVDSFRRRESANNGVPGATTLSSVYANGNGTGVPALASPGGGQRGAPSPPRLRRESAGPGRARPQDSEGFTSATTSETSELDTDEVLSFAPKRRSPPHSLASSSASSASTTRAQRSAHCKTETVSHPPVAAPNRLSGSVIPDGGTLGQGGARGADVNVEHQLAVHRSDILHDIAPQISRGVGEDGRVGSPPARPSSVSVQSNGTGIGINMGAGTGGSSTSSGAGTPTLASRGQRISESEVMRRRRLLDSHLIPTDPVIR